MTTLDDQKKLVNTVCAHFQSLPWRPLAKMQFETSHDAPAKGAIWISRTSFPAPIEPDIRNALYLVIERLKASYHEITPAENTPILDVGVEFIGVRSGVGTDAPEPEIPEIAKLEALEKECTSDMTILYIHGGGLYFSNPAEYRAASARLAKLTNARVASIKYRLAPIHTFPAPILDTLVAYASLLYPPPGAAYSAVPASKLVIAGNSAGANLCFGLTKFLVEFQKAGSTLPASKHKISFHGQTVSLPVPAGIATVSGWCDQCDALPSWHAKGELDILGVLQPACMPGHPTDEIWPSNPPREHPYCVAATLDHELVSPAAVRDWTGAPPMWFACGCEERGVDGNRVVASQATMSGVPVSWNEYEGMPHEFPLLMARLPQAKHAFEHWAQACSSFVAGVHDQSASVRWLMPDCKKMILGDPADLSPLPFEEVRKKMRQYNAARHVWTGKVLDSKL